MKLFQDEFPSYASSIMLVISAFRFRKWHETAEYLDVFCHSRQKRQDKEGRYKKEIRATALQ